MDIKPWRTTSYNHRRRCHPILTPRRSFSERHSYDIFSIPEAVKARSKLQSLFKSLRRKLRKEKNKVLTCTAPPPDPRQDRYNPYTYSQNFEDPESTWAEPDNLTRTFSAQFAATSTSKAKKGGALMASALLNGYGKGGN